jgi:hypothetical protein
MSEKPTVSGIFKMAQELRLASPDGSFNDVKAQIVSEYSGKEFPSPATLTIPELDNIAPEEDWTAGLPIVLRGIQNEDWNDVALGIVLSLEQVENYPKESGREDDPEKDWRNREKRIKEATEKSVGKWLPEDLMDVAKRSAKQ